MTVDCDTAQRTRHTARAILQTAIHLILALTCFQSAFPQPSDDTRLELRRTARPWEFISALGTRAGLIGNEGGNLEAWVYPLKILRNFHLRFKVDNEEFDGRALVRSVEVRPESTTIQYAWDSFTVRETIFVPVREPGALIKLEVDTTQPIQITAAFERDFQLEWPAAMGGSDIDWIPALHAFSMTENQQKFAAMVGSPNAVDFRQEYVTNYTADKENSFGFGTVLPGKSSKLIVMAASFEGLPAVEVTYRKLSNSYQELLADSAAYYQNYLRQHVRVVLPDSALQQAYEWAQVSVLQGLVTNPFLGTGLVAGYKISGDDQRPGYAWFFGRDALWTSLALDAEGDFATPRTAIEFLCKYQRKDGKVTHEIAQGASFVPWFDKLPYAYASADATPLLIIAIADYVKVSGDKEFALDKWDNIYRAYQFIRSTYDTDGLPRNQGIGHGWVETGPLLPVKSELYQTAVVIEALRSLSSIAKVLDKAETSNAANKEATESRLLLNNIFWIQPQQRFAFGIDGNGKQSDAASVLAAVPMWFGLLDDSKAKSMILEFERPSMQTAWGMRIISSQHPKYDAAGYHSGTVWPLFTGWAAVGEYRYHAAIPAYQNLRVNAMLTFDGSLGHVAEVLSGSYYQSLASGSPHQIWSSAMVISPLLRGLIGLETDALSKSVTFAPHVPADWSMFSVEQVQAGPCVLNLRYHRDINRIMLQVERKAGDGCTLNFSPALSLRSDVVSAEVNGRKAPLHMEENTSDHHARLMISLQGETTTESLKIRNDFGLSEASVLPGLGSMNKGLRILDEAWSPDRNTLTLALASATGGIYELGIWNPQQVESIDGARFVKDSASRGKLLVELSDAVSSKETQKEIVIHFVNAHHMAMADFFAKSSPTVH